MIGGVVALILALTFAFIQKHEVTPRKKLRLELPDRFKAKPVDDVMFGDEPCYNGDDVFKEFDLSRKWQRAVKIKRPIAWFILETIPYYSYRLYDNLKPSTIIRFISYRTFQKYHIVNTGLKPGYRDTDTILEQALFSLLKKFVEEECAWMEYILHTDKYDRSMWIKFKRRMFGFRDPEMGVAYLTSYAYDKELASPNTKSHRAILKAYKDIDKVTKREYEYENSDDDYDFRRNKEEIQKWVQEGDAIRNERTRILKSIITHRGHNF